MPRLYPGVAMAGRLFVCIMAYNEEENIANVITDVSTCGIVDEIIVVDDASTDRTGEIVASFPHVIYARNETNRGIGGTEKRLYDEFLVHSENDDDYMVVMHGDGQMRVEELHQFKQAFETTKASVVLGSRLLGRSDFRDAGRRPLWKILGDMAACTFVNMAFGTRLHSYGSAYRGWKRSAVEVLNYNECSSKVIFGIEIIAMAELQGLEMHEIPIETVYSEFGFNSNIVKYVFDVFGCAARYGPRIWIRKLRRG